MLLSSLLLLPLLSFFDGLYSLPLFDGHLFEMPLVVKWWGGGAMLLRCDQFRELLMP